MKVLSLSRPWPWAILKAGKRIENRKRKDGRMPHIVRHRGPLLLHAAQSWDKTALDWMFARGLIGRVDYGYLESQPDRQPAGVIFARCRGVGTITPTVDGRPSAAPLAERMRDPFNLRWWMGGYALIFDAVELTPLVPCRGHLGLWNVPDDVLAKLEGAAE